MYHSHVPQEKKEDMYHSPVPQEKKGRGAKPHIRSATRPTLSFSLSSLLPPPVNKAGAWGSVGPLLRQGCREWGGPGRQKVRQLRPQLTGDAVSTKNRLPYFPNTPPPHPLRLPSPLPSFRPPSKQASLGCSQISGLRPSTRGD